MENTYPILAFFRYDHLPARLQAISAPFASLAEQMSAIPTENRAEIAAGLRKLLEAKDCAVRAAL
jgi:hypothetical protein